METNIENLEFKNDENLTNQNEPKLLYRLDKRNPLCVAFDLIGFLLVCWIPIIFAIPNFVLDISIFSIILNIVCIYISLIVLQILYSVIFFDYFEIYEDKIIYANFLGLKQIIDKKNFSHIHSIGKITENICIFKFGKFYNKLIPSILITALTIKESIEINEKIFEMKISKF